MQDLFGLQLLLRPGLAKGGGDAVQALHAAAELLGLVGDGLQGAAHRVEPEGLQQGEGLGHVRHLQRRVLGELLDPGGSLLATFDGPHQGGELGLQAFVLVAGLQHRGDAVTDQAQATGEQAQQRIDRHNGGGQAQHAAAGLAQRLLNSTRAGRMVRGGASGRGLLAL
ncbi:hypothetical protein D9M68_714830 [compost metagenome]